MQLNTRQTDRSARFTKPATGLPPGPELGGRRRGRFELVLHGSRLCLAATLRAAKEVAHRLLERPSCCLPGI